MLGGKSIDKLDFAILDTLLSDLNASTQIGAVTIDTLLEKINIEKDELDSRVQGMLKYHLINLGIPDADEVTYYISKSGKRLLEEVSRE